MSFANPVDGPRIVPFGEARLPTDKLPNGQPGFRVTQRFADVNPAFPQFGQHGALDVGNFNCGPRVLAMAAGSVSWVYTDNAGAKCIVLAHGATYTTLYAHLSRQDVTVGQTVKEGQPIGLVGDTGLGAICHLHVEVRRNGVKVDPWPLLRQNQAAPTPVPEDDDVNPKTDVPVGRADIGLVTVYADRDRKAKLLEAPWQGTNIETYWTAPAPIPSPAPLVPIRLNLSGPTKPPDFRVGWVGADKVTPKAAADCAAEAKKAATAVAQAAATKAGEF